MRKIIKLNIVDEFIEGGGVSIGAVGSHDETEIECHFSELWENTTKTVCWTNSMGEPVTITVTPLMDVDGNGNTYRVPVPAEAKKYSGEAGLTIKGCLIDDETAKEIIAVVTGTAYFLVPEAIWGEGETEDVTPSQAEQLQAEIDEIKETIGDAQKSAAAAAESHQRASVCADIAANCMNNAAASADNALKSEAYVVQQARNSESWAVGGTGTRENEDINNAKYWSEQAQNAAGGGVTSFNGRQGVVMPDKNDYPPAFIGAMDKSVYDANSDGVVDNAERLGGQLPEYYATKAEVQTAQTAADNAQTAADNAQTAANNARPKTVNVTKENEDLNNYKEDGIYFFHSYYTPVNIPAGVNGWLIVYKTITETGGEVVKQIWYRFGTLESNDHNMWVRTYGSGNWGSWTKIITEKDIAPKWYPITSFTTGEPQDANTAGYWVCGKMVVVYVRVKKGLALPGSQNVPLFTMPSGYRPSRTIDAPAYTEGSKEVKGVVAVGGTVNLYAVNGFTTTSITAFTAVYFLE